MKTTLRHLTYLVLPLLFSITVIARADDPGIPFQCDPSAPTGLTYTISNQVELRAFADCVSSGNSEQGQIIKLTKDLDLAEIPFPVIGKTNTPFGSAPEVFRGTFDGQNHDIKHLLIDTTDSSYYRKPYAGLFASLGSTATVKDLLLSDATVKIGDNKNGGLLAASSAGTIDNVSVSGKIIYSLSSGGSVGGLVGQDQGVINNSNVRVTADCQSVDKSCYNFGGLVGSARTISSNIKVKIAKSWAVVNLAHSKTLNNVGVNFLGGLVGMLASGNIEISQSAAQLNFPEQGGADVGSGVNKLYLGGLVGQIAPTAMTDMNITLDQDMATGDIEGATNPNYKIGGLIGSVGSDSTTSTNTPVSVTNSYSTLNVNKNGKIFPEVEFGGLIASVYQPVSLSNDYYAGSSQLYLVKGGLVAKDDNHVSTCENSYWDKDVSQISVSEACGAAGAQSTADMQKEGTYTDWDFSDIWAINAGQYPHLANGVLPK